MTGSVRTECLHFLSVDEQTCFVLRETSVLIKRRRAGSQSVDGLQTRADPRKQKSGSYDGEDLQFSHV